MESEATHRNHGGKAGGTSTAKKEHGGRDSSTRSASRTSRGQSEMSKEGLLRVVRSLPRTIGVQLRTHPPETVAAIGVVSFALGAVVGSRLGRLLLAVAIPIAVKSALEGEVVHTLEKYAQGFIRSIESPGRSDA
jgi:hypothetical protein